MKTAELTGAQLDLWVAKALDWRFDPHHALLHYTLQRYEGGVLVQPAVSRDDSGEDFSPSTVWDHGGPIIERERIAVMPFGEQWAAGFHPRSDCRMVNDGDGHFDDMSSIEMDQERYGETALIAAMRAYVTRKFGENIPDEIT